MEQSVKPCLCAEYIMYISIFVISYAQQYKGCGDLIPASQAKDNKINGTLQI